MHQSESSWHCRAYGWYAQDYSSSHAQTGTSRQRMVVICMSIRRTHDERERALGREWPHPLFGQLVSIWKSHDKAKAKSLDDRGSVGYLLDINIWQSGTTRIMQARMSLGSSSGSIMQVVSIKGLHSRLTRISHPSTSLSPA